MSVLPLHRMRPFDGAWFGTNGENTRTESSVPSSSELAIVLEEWPLSKSHGASLAVRVIPYHLAFTGGVPPLHSHPKDHAVFFSLGV